MCDLITIDSSHLTTSTAPSAVKPPMKGFDRTLKAASKLATCITFLAADACKKMWEKKPLRRSQRNVFFSPPLSFAPRGLY